MKLNYSIIFFLVFSLFTCISCGGEKNKGNTQNTVDTVKVKRVKVETVEMVNVEDNVTFTATVEANILNNINPNIPGRIRKILVDIGENVRKGQVLVEMDNATLQQQMTQIETLKKDYERYKELYEVGGISKQQLDQMETQINVAQTSLSNLKENTRLVSPINGVVTARNFDNGDMAGGMPILTVENINPVKIKINVSESYYSLIKKGMKTEVEVDALADERFVGTITQITPRVDPMTHTFPIQITVTNANAKIMPGMFARVTLNMGANMRPLISDMAVQKQSGSSERYVFVVKDGKVVYTVVELGKRVDDKYEILSGLEQGDLVVKHGNKGLLNGDSVEILDN